MPTLNILPRFHLKAPIMKKLLLAFNLTAVLVGLHTPVLASPVNLTSWQSFGDSRVTTNSATVTTAFSSEAAVGSGALDISSLESLLNTAPGTLGANAYEGSALSQSFNLGSGGRLSFSWTLGTDIFDVGFADLAFVLVDGALLLPLANVAATELSGVFSYTFSAGSHTFALGMVDINDVAGVSSLTVSNVNLASVTSTVPEPASLALMLAAMVSFAYTKRRQRGGGRRL